MFLVFPAIILLNSRAAGCDLWDFIIQYIVCLQRPDKHDIDISKYKFRDGSDGLVSLYELLCRKGPKIRAVNDGDKTIWNSKRDSISCIRISLGFDNTKKSYLLYLLVHSGRIYIPLYFKAEPGGEWTEISDEEYGSFVPSSSASKNKLIRFNETAKLYMVPHGNESLIPWNDDNHQESTTIESSGEINCNDSWVSTDATDKSEAYASSPNLRTLHTELDLEIDINMWESSPEYTVSNSRFNKKRVLIYRPRDCYKLIRVMQQESILWEAGENERCVKIIVAFDNFVIKYAKLYIEIGVNCRVHKYFMHDSQTHEHPWKEITAQLYEDGTSIPDAERTAPTRSFTVG